MCEIIHQPTGVYNDFNRKPAKNLIAVDKKGFFIYNLSTKSKDGEEYVSCRTQRGNGRCKFLCGKTEGRPGAPVPNVIKDRRFPR